ncbi:MAG: Gallidermin [Thermoleophilaceae bacterium]|jgi:gallidermin/nisin family lantibiotic|nr:Gallidermin [Thermoleophilaceae bacterium]MEA2457115.1 Gallidermin [Thermoleophilaceae bacterium]
MADGGLEAKQELSKNHQLAAGQHDAAAHHHRQAAFHLASGDSALAKQHGAAAVEHGQQAQSLAGGVGNWDDYDLDVNFDGVEESTIQPMITSYSLCTPTCGNTGSGNSFCCSAVNC